MIKYISILFFIIFVVGCKQQADLKHPAAHYERITVHGQAEHSKAGAIVITDNNEVYYIDNKMTWEDSLYLKKVSVTGIPYTRKISESDLKDKDGNYIQGAVGEIKHLTSVKYKLVKQ